MLGTEWKRSRSDFCFRFCRWISWMCWSGYFTLFCFCLFCKGKVLHCARYSVRPADSRRWVSLLWRWCITIQFCLAASPRSWPTGDKCCPFYLQQNFSHLVCMCYFSTSAALHVPEEWITVQTYKLIIIVSDPLYVTYILEIHVSQMHLCYNTVYIW